MFHEKGNSEMRVSKWWQDFYFWVSYPFISVWVHPCNILQRSTVTVALSKAVWATDPWRHEQGLEKQMAWRQSGSWNVSLDVPGFLDCEDGVGCILASLLNPSRFPLMASKASSRLFSPVCTKIAILFWVWRSWYARKSTYCKVIIVKSY